MIIFLEKSLFARATREKDGFISTTQITETQSMKINVVIFFKELTLYHHIMGPKRNTVNKVTNKEYRNSVFEEEGPSSEGLCVQGLLLKKGNNIISPWQSRYFVAKGHYLKYYKSQEVCDNRDYCLAALDLDLCEVRDNIDKVIEVVLLGSDVTTLKANR